MTLNRTVHRVSGKFKAGYSGDTQQPLFFEVNVEGQVKPIRFLVTPEQAYDLDIGMYLLRPEVSGRNPDGTPITDRPEASPMRVRRRGRGSA
jgi:hypothetical protein